MIGILIAWTPFVGLAGMGAPAVEVARVADLIPGPEGSCPCLLTPFGDSLCFRAKEAAGGYRCALWRFDGTQVERFVLPEGDYPTDLVVSGGILHFFAGGKLWWFDGSSVSAAPGWRKLTVPEELVAYGGDLIFRATDFATVGTELWKYDGATVSSIDIFPGKGNSYPQHFIEYGGLLYFNACGPTTGGTELFRYDGSAVSLAANMGNGSSPENFALFRGKLYFSAYTPEGGRELWRFDGFRADRAADIAPGAASSNPSGLRVYGDALYFAAEGGEDGFELWRFDGEKAEEVANINRNPPLPGVDPVHHSFPADLTVLDGVLYFSADDGVHGRELWSFDGTEAALVADIDPGRYGSEPSGLLSWNGALWFAADEGVAGSELWRLAAVRPAFLRGDSNGDGSRDISDPITTLEYLFLGGGLPCEKSADANDSGEVDVSDAVFTLLGQYRGLPAPELVGPCCADDTPDELTCERYASCP